MRISPQLLQQQHPTIKTNRKQVHRTIQIRKEQIKVLREHWKTFLFTDIDEDLRNLANKWTNSKLKSKQNEQKLFLTSQRVLRRKRIENFKQIVINCLERPKDQRFYFIEDRYKETNKEFKLEQNKVVIRKGFRQQHQIKVIQLHVWRIRFIWIHSIHLWWHQKLILSVIITSLYDIILWKSGQKYSDYDSWHI